jgi:hypothetical protein
MVFEGEEWEWNSWTYLISLKTGGKIEGSGRKDDKGIQTEKLLLGGGDVPQVLLKEKLIRITLQEYEATKAKLFEGNGPVAGTDPKEKTK